jgi:hypothetical protein
MSEIVHIIIIKSQILVYKNIISSNYLVLLKFFHVNKREIKEFDLNLFDMKILFSVINIFFNV